MKIRTMAALAMTGALALVGTACSDDEVGSRQDVVDLFVNDSGLSTEMAECMADGTIDAFGLDTMNERREMTSEEEAQMETIFNDCVEEVGVENIQPSTTAGSADDIDCSMMPDDESKALCEEGKADLQEMEDEAGG